MLKDYQSKKKWTYIAAFIGQFTALYLAIQLGEGKLVLLFLPTLLMAILFYVIYHRLGRHTMWSYLGIHCGSALCCYFFGTILLKIQNTGKPLPSNCFGPVVDIIGIGIVLTVVLVSTFPVCIVYSLHHAHYD